MADQLVSRLFTPMKIGTVTTNHRIVMAPTSRLRATADHVPLPFVKDYYAERAVVPGTLIFSEATIVSARAGGFPNMPGIYSEPQIAAWKEVVDAVHARGSFMFLQILGNGRVVPLAAREKEGFDVIGPSAVPLTEDSQKPREMTEEEILGTISDFAQAAKNAIEKAGFDGIEINGANGHLPEQFIQDVTNKRTDAWGGSIEKRARFVIEIAKAVSAAVGKERVGVRFSPFSRYLGMRMKDPIPQYTYLIRQLRDLGLAHLHLIEPRIDGDIDKITTDSNNMFVEAWGGEGALLLAGGYTPNTARQAVEETYKNKNVAIAFGRHFTSNPDLVFRVHRGINFAPYERATFYDAMNPEGYIGYKFSEEFIASQTK